MPAGTSFTPGFFILPDTEKLCGPFLPLVPCFENQEDPFSSISLTQKTVSMLWFKVGTEKAVKLLEKNNWNKDLLLELVKIMGDASICGLGQAAGNPIKSALNYFSDDI